MAQKGFRPGCWGYVFAVVLFIGGIGGCMGFMASGAMGMMTGGTKVEAPGTTQVQLDPGIYAIAAEVSKGETFPQVTAKVLSENDEELALQPPQGQSTYTYQNVEGRVIHAVEIKEKGNYWIEAETENDAPCTLRIVTAPVSTFVWGFVVFGIGAALGLIVGIATIVMNSRKSS